MTTNPAEDPEANAVFLPATNPGPGSATDSIPALRTERLLLLPLDPTADADALHAMLSDPEVFRYDPENSPSRTLAETRARLTEELTGCGGWTWAVHLHGEEVAIGTVGLFFDQGTPIRGLTWRLRRDHWGRGIMSEAARAAVDNLLTQPGIDGVEAWIDSRNTRSLGVARRAGLDERSRLPLVHGDYVGQRVVIARSAMPRDPETLVCRPTLVVRDVRGTAEVLARVFGLHILFSYGEPPTYARLGVGPWSDSPGLELSAPNTDAPITPTSCSIDIGIATDTVYQRVRAAGLTVDGPPADRPWYRREFAVTLPDGHRVRVIGPPSPG